jgi:hypothetical protein
MTGMSDEGELLRCAWCGKEFRRPTTIGRTPKYCRRSHRQRAVEGRRTNNAVEAAITRTLAGPASLSARAETERGRPRGRGAEPVNGETLF